MLNLELSNEIIDPEAGFDQPWEEPRDALVASCLQLYRREMDEHLARVTGSPNKFLNVDQEQALATTVQAGRAAQKTRDEDNAAYLAKQGEFDAQIEAGTLAETTLVEANLRYAASLARASMNIFAPTRQEEDEDTGFEHPDTSTNKINRHKSVRTFGDIRDLRSRYADMLSRIQVANEGLMKAARDFKPIAGESGRPIKFTTYATWKIHGELSRYVKLKEKPGWYVPMHIAEKIARAHKDPDEMASELAAWDEGRFTVSLDSLAFPETGIEDEEAPVGILDIADIAGDEREDVEAEALAFDATDIITKAFERLAGIDESEAERLTAEERRWRVKGCREVGIIAMRFGVSDDPEIYGGKPTLDDVAKAYGVTRERIRQIESKTLAKLRKIFGQLGVETIEDVLGGSAHALADSHLPAAEYAGNIRTGRARAYGGRDVKGPVVKLDVPDPEAYRGSEVRPQKPRDRLSKFRRTEAPVVPRQREPFEQTLSERREVPKESWQTYAGEPFDMQEADGLVAAERRINGEAVARQFRDYLFNEAPDKFIEYFSKDLPTDYPVLLVNTVDRRFGRNLTAEHIERFWNSHIETFVSSFGDAINEKSLSAVCSYFSKLLAERMTDQSTIELRIPESLNGRLNYLGAFVTNGRLDIYGVAGDFAGYKLGGIGRVIIHGSAGDFAGVSANGFGMLEVRGDAGHFFGGQTRNAASVEARGSVGDYCGEGMVGREVGIFVGGDAGDEIASGAVRGEITVLGRMGTIAASKNPKVTILTAPGNPPDQRTERRAS